MFADITTTIYKASLQKWIFVPYVFRRYRSRDITWSYFRSLLILYAVSSQLRSSSIFTHFHSDSRVATISTTSEYGTVPKRPGGNEVQSSMNEERTRNEPSSGPKFYWAMRSEMKYVYCACKHEFSVLLVVIRWFPIFFPLMGKCLIFCSYYYSLCRRRKEPLISLSGGLGLYIFCRKMEKKRPMREEMDGKAFFSCLSRHFCLGN